MPITDGIESAGELLAQIALGHPLSNGDGLTIDAEVEEGQAGISHLPVDGSFSPEKRVKGVFDLDDALVAGIINNARESQATGTS